MLNPVQIKRNVPSDRSIGAILVESGKLTQENAEPILRLQQEENLPFGEAAVKLGMLSPKDIQFALAHQYDYPYLMPGDGTVSNELLAAYQPFSPQVEALRGLRSQLLLRWFSGSREQKMLSIVSPGQGEGRSYLAANLALVFAQLGERTLLIDADMRAPRQHSLFNLENRHGLSSILSGRSTGNDMRRISAFPSLTVLPSGPLPPNPQELLGRASFAEFLGVVRHEFDVVILDTPPACNYADAQAIASHSRGVLMTNRRNRTRLADAGRLTAGLTQLGATVVGAVLSDF